MLFECPVTKLALTSVVAHNINYWYVKGPSYYNCFLIQDQNLSVDCSRPLPVSIPIARIQAVENFESVENNSTREKNIFNMKISQAVSVLAISTSGEKLAIDRTRQFDIAPTEDGARSGISSM